MTTISRRTALAGSVALPLAPAAALATGEFPQSSAEPDPFILALRDFLAAETAYIESFNLPGAREADGDEFVKPYCAASFAARRRMAETLPTTPAGLRAMIQALVPMFGEPKGDLPANILNPDAHDIKGPWAENVCEVYIRNLLAAAERILNGNDEEA